MYVSNSTGMPSPVSNTDRMGRPAKFTRQQLQSAALAIVDAQGVAALSMRSLAGALGTGAMTLYNYVSMREDLDVLVVEAVLAETRWPALANLAWRDEVRAIATGMWQAVRRHPHAIPLIMTRRSRTPAVFDVAEALLAALARGGLSGRALLLAFRAVSSLVMGMAQNELAGPLALRAGESAQKTIARFRALPPARFPRLVEVAEAAQASSADAEFDAALAMLIEGIAASA